MLVTKFVPVLPAMYVIKEGFSSLDESEEEEDDMLDKAWGLEPTSRLSCQAKVKDQDITS